MFIVNGMIFRDDISIEKLESAIKDQQVAINNYKSDTAKMSSEEKEGIDNLFPDFVERRENFISKVRAAVTVLEERDKRSKSN